MKLFLKCDWTLKKYSEYCIQNTCKKYSKYCIEYFQKKVFKKYSEYFLSISNTVFRILYSEYYPSLKFSKPTQKWFEKLLYLNVFIWILLLRDVRTFR